MTTDSVSDAMTTDKELDALVERLPELDRLYRAHQVAASYDNWKMHCDLWRMEAHNAVAAISALRKERDDYKTWWERDSTSLGKALAEARHHRVIAQDFRALAATLREERDRLREALEEIVWQCEGRIDINSDGGPNVAMVMDSIARAALSALRDAGIEP